MKRVEGSILCLCLLISASILSQDTMSLEIENIVIKENRLEIPFNDVSRNITVINKAQIDQLAPASINELLQTVAGIDIRQRGVNGVQADISIRGGTFEQSLVLINGVKMLDPQTGHHLMNLPVSIEDIERIEVLKGPGARVFGQNAFAGAINIVTKVTSEQNGSVSFTAGQNGLLDGYIGLSVPLPRYEQKVSYSYNQSDGYRPNTDYNIHNFFYQAKASIGKGTLDIFGGYVSRDFGANGFYGSETFTDQYERTRTSLINVSMTQNLKGWKIQPRINWRRNFDNWMFRRQDPEFFQNFHTSHVASAEVHSSRAYSAGIFGLGVEYNYVNLTSNNLGDHKRGQFGLHLENRFLFADESLDVTPGMYVLHISDFGTKFYPGLDVGYRISHNWKAFGNVAFTSRIPSFTDLYYEDNGNLGNPSLKEESALTFELGLKLNTGFHQLTASLFRRNASDLIDWYKVNPDDKWTPDNFSSASYSGLDIGTFWSLGKSSLLSGLRVNYLYLNAALNESDFPFSRNALENLRHQLIVNPHFKITKNLKLNVLWKYNDRVSLEDYNIIDANISYQFDRYTFYFKANNLTNTRYRETNLVPMPDRWLMFGVRLVF